MTLKTHASPGPQPSPTPPDPVSLLILGAGWTSTFLLPLLTSNSITHAATTRSGSDNTIPFTFSPDSDDPGPYTLLPSASTILITFPLKGAAEAHHIVSLYNTTHPTPPNTTTPDSKKTRQWILFGSTGIWTGDGWHSETSPYNTDSPRAQAEDALLALPSTSPSSSFPANITSAAAAASVCILNLSGLYGSTTRRPRDWLIRVARSKSELRAKGCVHLIHGRDVARAVVLCMRRWDEVAGKRWVLTDLRVYDWWGLGMEWGRYARKQQRVVSDDDDEEGEGKGLGLGDDGKARAGREDETGARLQEYMYEQWVRELMEEEGVRGLPRDSERLGRKMDGRGFWGAVGDVPEVGRVESL